MMLRPKEVRHRLGISYATVREYVKKGYIKPVLEIGKWRFRGAIQGSFANCNISVDLDLFNEGIIEYI